MSGFIKTFNTVLGPKAIGPYSSAKIYKGVMYVSGQIGIDPKTSELVSDDVELQTRRAMENVKIILSETNCNFQHVLKSTLYLKVCPATFRRWTISSKSTPSTRNTSNWSRQQEHVWLLRSYPKMQNSKSR
jgi:enamine deaminase RidA (YjgF/YER057c/UK114 family)